MGVFTAQTLYQVRQLHQTMINSIKEESNCRENASQRVTNGRDCKRNAKDCCLGFWLYQQLTQVCERNKLNYTSVHQANTN